MTTDTKTLRNLADLALPAPWESGNAGVPYGCKQEFKEAMTPEVAIKLLDALERKDALLREALRALKYHSDQTRPIERTFDTMDKIKGELT